MRKIFRFLPQRFRLKVTKIDENKDLDTIKVEKRVDSLQIYESSFPQIKKSKSIASKTVKEDWDDSSNEKILNDENLSLIDRKFKKFLFHKKVNGKQKQIKESWTKKGKSEKRIKNNKTIRIKSSVTSALAMITLEWSAQTSRTRRKNPWILHLVVVHIRWRKFVYDILHYNCWRIP